MLFVTQEYVFKNRGCWGGTAWNTSRETEVWDSRENEVNEMLKFQDLEETILKFWNFH